MSVTFLIAGAGLYVFHSVYALAASLAVAGLVEIAYCSFVVIKNKMR